MSFDFGQISSGCMDVDLEHELNNIKTPPPKSFNKKKRHGKTSATRIQSRSSSGPLEQEYGRQQRTLSLERRPRLSVERPIPKKNRNSLGCSPSLYKNINRSNDFDGLSQSSRERMDRQRRQSCPVQTPSKVLNGGSMETIRSKTRNKIVKQKQSIVTIDDDSDDNKHKKRRETIDNHKITPRLKSEKRMPTSETPSSIEVIVSDSKYASEGTTEDGDSKSTRNSTPRNYLLTPATQSTHRVKERVHENETTPNSSCFKSEKNDGHSRTPTSSEKRLKKRHYDETRNKPCFKLTKANGGARRPGKSAATKVIPGSSMISSSPFSSKPMEEIDDASSDQEESKSNFDSYKGAGSWRPRDFLNIRADTSPRRRGMYGRKTSKLRSPSSYCDFPQDNAIITKSFKNHSSDDELWQQPGERGVLKGSPKSKRYTSRRKEKVSPEVISIESSDEDDEVIETESVTTPSLQQEIQSQTRSAPSEKTAGDRELLDVVCIVIGKNNVQKISCEMKFRTGGPKQFISLHYKEIGDYDDEEGVNAYEKIRLNLEPETILEMRYFLADDSEQDDNGATKTDKVHKAELSPSSEISSNNTNDDPISFIAMRVKPNEKNKLAKFLNSTEQISPFSLSHSTSSSEVLIVAELRSNEQFKQVRTKITHNNSLLRHFLVDTDGLKAEETNSFTAALKNAKKKENEDRISSTKKMRTRSRTRALFYQDAKQDGDSSRLLLVFPFTVDKELMEDAAKELNEPRGYFVGQDEQNEKGVSEALDTSEETMANCSTSAESGANKVRKHYLTIRGDDYNRLDPYEYLNDTLIDFWMQWIWRHENPAQSKVHFFTSHFYTTLLEDGVDAVSSWTRKKCIDVFSKDLVFIPINQSLHWSLCVVVNPGYLRNSYKRCKHRGKEYDKTDRLPCLLFMDSLKAHRKAKVAKKVREWLNFEWERVKGDGGRPFTQTHMEIYDPRIPYQDNSWDCGVFVCRYAFALYQQRHVPITYEDVESEILFQKTITDSQGFKFNMKDIIRLRKEMRILIDNLSELYKKASNC